MNNKTDRLMASAYSEYWKHTADMAFIKGIDGVYVCASMAFAEMVGRTGPEEIIGRTDADIFADQELVRRYTDDDARLLAGNVSLENYVEPITAQNGRPRYSITSKYILRDEQGNPSGILGIGRDITIEYEARQNYEYELKTLFELPPDAPAAVLFDVTGWRVVNMRFRDKRNQVVSRYSRIDEYFENVVPQIVEDESVRTFFSTLSQASLLAAYNEGKRSFSLEYLRRMPDESTRWVRDDFHFLLDPVTGNLSLIIVLRDIDQAKREYSELILAAQQDAMTGLLNHDATLRCIERYLASASGVQALIMIDLDNFKQVNDNFGHQYGDVVLAEAAEAIRNVFRATDIIGRLGGDEFMVLMKDVPSEVLVRHKMDELIVALQFSSGNESKTLAFSTSVGVTLFRAGEQDFNTLYSEADAALYQSKSDGKNRCSFFTHDGQRSHTLPSPVLENVNTVQLRTLLDYMDGGVILAEVSDDIRITYVSPSLYKSFARDPHDMASLSEGLFSSVLLEDLPKLRAALFEAASSSDLLDYAFRVLYGGGIEWRRIRAKCIPESGDGIHRLVGVVTDISELKRANEYLRETEARYRIAVEQANALLWEVDIASRILTLSGPAWANFSNATRVFPDAPESYLATNALPADSFTAFRQMFADIYAGVNSGSRYFKMYDETGAEAWISAQFTLLFNEDGTPYCALGATQFVPNINAEMNRFEQEIRFSDLVSSTLQGCVRVNLTQNRLEYAEVGCDFRYAHLVGTAYDAYLANNLRSFIAQEDIPQLRALIATDALLEKFRSGEGWQFASYRRLDEQGCYCWISLLIKLMRHPISGDVYAFAYLRDNEMRRRWELALDGPVQRDMVSLLYSQRTMRAMAAHIFAAYPENSLVAVSVFELTALTQAQNGDESVSPTQINDLLVTFGRLCWIVISGDVIIGRLDENRVAVLRANAGGAAPQRKRVSDAITLLKTLLSQTHTEVNVNLVAGYAVDVCGYVTFDTLLKKATIACRSAAQTLGESTVAYADVGGFEPSADEDELDLAEKYRTLELRYQQLASIFRVSENDDLTGIWGKQAFYRHVRELLERSVGTAYAIVRFDINRFKVYNDVRGTAAGDTLLRDIAKQIRHAPGSALHYARLESDHFVLLTPDDKEIIARSAAALSKWLADYSKDFRLSASIGVYPIEDPSVKVLLMCDRALLALRSVKSGFDTRLAYYDAGLRERLLEEQLLVGDIEAALQSEQFVLYFQPQVSYETGMLVGAEALVRWNHPKRGLLSPDVFIPLFEKNGLITKLDEYVWDRCCRYIKAWMQQYPQARALALSVSVNVSRLDIYDDKLCGILCDAVRRHGISPASLRLEITESAYMENPRQLIDTVQELQNAGFTVEMDDFGSGYSSLNTLKDVCVDVLKLDMKFLADCIDSARGGNILSSVIRMAHWLKLPIIAEGVETKAQADYLKSLGCVYMQGYYFARPMPAADFEEMLAEGRVCLINKYQDANIEGMAAFWDASAQTALLFNSFVGGAAIMEYHNGNLEASRVNDNFYKTLGTSREAYLPIQTNVLAQFDEENRATLVTVLEQAITTGEEYGCELRALPLGGVTRLWSRYRVRMLAQNNDRAIFYISIEDITDRKCMEQDQQAESERDRLLMKSTGIGFFDYDIAGDVCAYQLHLPDRGITRRIIPHFYDAILASKLTDAPSAQTIRSLIDDLPAAPESGEFEYRANLWGAGMRWCRTRYVGVRGANGSIYRLVGQIDDIQDIKDRAAVAESIRAQLQAGGPSYTFNDTVVNQIASLFYNAADTYGAIETTLALLGKYYDLSRAYIFEDDPQHETATNTFEWCAPGVAPQQESLQGISYEVMGGRETYIGHFDRNGVYYCPDVTALAPEARAVLEPQGIRSMLQCAIRDGGVFSGMIGFDECRETRRWTDEQVGTLMFVSRIMAAFLLRMRQADNVAFSADFRQALDDNAAYVYVVDPATYEIIYTNKAIQDYAGEDYIGQTCYKAFIGQDTPCPDCPVLHLHESRKHRLAEIIRLDGMILLSHASPLRWNGRDMAMLACVDVTESRRGGTSPAQKP